MNKKEVGTLYIVGTPIGNLGDITLRAIDTLKYVDVILAEDTRQTLKLLNHLNIQKHLISYHRHNEADKIQKVVAILEENKNVALVSDAGMPVISDPGEELIKYLIANCYKVEVIPGVTAIVSAIVKSSFDSSRFCFEGFLSVNKKQRNKRLNELSMETRTMVFYEAPHKILSTLQDMESVFKNRNICIAREITKLHEQFIYTNISDAILEIKKNGIRGEIVLVIEGRDIKELEDISKEEISNIDIREFVEEKIKNGVSKKDAIKEIAKLKRVSKNEVYQECIDIAKE